MTILFLQRTLGNLYKCYTVLKKLSAFGAVTKPYVQFGRREPFEMTVKNHRATLLPPALRTLHVMLTWTVKEVICSVVSFFSKTEERLFHGQEPGINLRGPHQLPRGLLASVSSHLLR